MFLFNRFSILILTSVAFACIFGFLGLKTAWADNGGLVSLINQYRTSKGISSLVEDQKLTNASCWFAIDMTENNYFPADHVDSQSRSMSQRLADFGVATGSRGENIAKTYRSTSGQTVIDLWQNSSGHNTIMLDPVYTRVGVGIGTNGDYSYWSADFASGTANTLTTACGAPVYATPAPTYATPTPPKTPTTKPVTPTPTITTSSPVVTIPATPTTIATKSASLSAKTVSTVKRPFKPALKQSPTLVQGIALTTFTLSNFLLCGFIFWRLYHYFRLR